MNEILTKQAIKDIKYLFNHKRSIETQLEIDKMLYENSKLFPVKLNPLFQIHTFG
jgi:hypothetical protein